jgi:hypothetical protein
MARPARLDSVDCGSYRPEGRQAISGREAASGACETRGAISVRRMVSTTPGISEVSVRVCYAYREDYIPYRCRKTRTRWYADRTISTVRSIPRSQFAPAFSITCNRPRHRTRQPWTVEVSRFDGQLWWEIPFGPLMPNMEHFFREVARGRLLDQIALGLPCEWREVTNADPEPRERFLLSTKTTMEARAQHIRNNVLIVDDQLFVRGGDPLWIGNQSSTKLDRRTAELVNSGIEIGKPVHVNPFPPFHRDDPGNDQLQAAAADGYVFGLSTRVDDEHPESHMAPSTWHVEKRSEFQPQVNPIHFQAEAGLRQLASGIQKIVQRRKFPRDLANEAIFFTSMERYEKSTIEKCVSGLISFVDWCEQLPPRDGRVFAEVHSFARRLVASILRRGRMEGGNHFESIDDEALGKLIL